MATACNQLFLQYHKLQFHGEVVCKGCLFHCSIFNFSGCFSVLNIIDCIAKCKILRIDNKIAIVNHSKIFSQLFFFTWLFCVVFWDFLLKTGITAGSVWLSSVLRAYCLGYYYKAVCFSILLVMPARNLLNTGFMHLFHGHYLWYQHRS